MVPKTKRVAERELDDEIGEFYADPYGFVVFAYPWGQVGTPLAGETGPDEWQRKFLEKLGAKVGGGGVEEEAIRQAVASGHGVGKSAMVAWLIQWAMSTRPHVNIVVTANTETQLNTKTWRELAKWHKLLINRHWFEWTATQYKHVDHGETWYASAITWSEQRPEAFAGTHDKHTMLIFDEASAIADIIWDNGEGAMTTAGAMWFVFGNMTRGVGKFVDCFERFRHRWEGTHVDSRTAKKANQKQIAEWIEDYGEDSDFVRIRVRGVKPRSGSKQFISHETIFNCHQYKAEGIENFPKVMSVDVARSGDCESVAGIRQGRKLYPQTKWRERDSMQLAGYIVELMKFWKPQVCFIEGNGLGGPIIDRLRQLGWGDTVIEVNPGIKLKDTEECANHRSLWWQTGKKALEEGMELPTDPDLDAQLAMVEYGYNDKMQLQIQKKEDMTYSPDRADQLMLTFCGGAVVRLAKDVMPMSLPMMGCV